MEIKNNYFVCPKWIVCFGCLVLLLSFSAGASLIAEDTLIEEAEEGGRIEEDGQVYKGGWLDGKAHGFGQWYNPRKKAGYIGFFENGLRVNSGLYLLTDSLTPLRVDSDFGEGKLTGKFNVSNNSVDQYFSLYETTKGAENEFFSVVMKAEDFRDIHYAHFGVTSNDGYKTYIIKGRLFFGLFNDDNPVDHLMEVEVTGSFSEKYWINILKFKNPEDFLDKGVAEGFCVNITDKIFYRCEWDNFSAKKSEELGRWELSTDFDDVKPNKRSRSNNK